jgi:transcriptional regulator with PAS, ATPase and Fis domain
VGRSQCAEFTPEAVFALLYFEWPRNYKQIQEVIQAAVSADAEELIRLDALKEIMGVSIDPGEPESRIGALMKAEQSRYFEEQMEQLGLTAAGIAKELELDDSVQTKQDLKSMPLIRSELDHL